MTKTLIAGVIASALAVAAMPANAADWSEKIQLCAAAAQSEGLASEADYNVRFLSGGSRRLTIEMVPSAGGEPVVAECKIARGKIKEVQLQA